MRLSNDRCVAASREGSLLYSERRVDAGGRAEGGNELERLKMCASNLVDDKTTK